MSYEPFQRVIRGGADQISDIKKETPVIPLNRQVDMTGGGFKDMLNTTVSTQSFKIANDNKKHYEALCRRIQLNQQQIEIPQVAAEPVQAESPPELDIQPPTQTAANGDSHIQMDIEPQIVQLEQDATVEMEAAPQQDAEAVSAMERGVADTHAELKIIHAYMAEQKFEAEQAEEFLKYVVREQATQFVQAPQLQQQQGAQAHTAPQMNFVAIDAMREAMAQGQLPLEQHQQKNMFMLNSLEMAQPVAADQPQTTPVGKLDVQIEKQLQTIAASNQFDAKIVQQAAELQIVSPEQNGAVVGNPVEAPIAQTSGPDNTDKALTLINQAKQQNAEAEIIRLHSSNNVYFREKHIQAVTVTGEKINMSFDSKSTRFDAERKIATEADAGGLNLEQQSMRFDGIARDMKDNYQSRIQQQGDELRERKGFEHVSVIDTGSNSRDYTARAKRQSAETMMENQDSMLASSKNLLKDVAAAPDMTMSIR